eukprot:1152272-Pelagomonas_calceolata.AAC.2
MVQHVLKALRHRGTGALSHAPRHRGNALRRCKEALRHAQPAAPPCLPLPQGTCAFTDAGSDNTTSHFCGILGLLRMFGRHSCHTGVWTGSGPLLGPWTAPAQSCGPTCAGPCGCRDLIGANLSSLRTGGTCIAAHAAHGCRKGLRLTSQSSNALWHALLMSNARMLEKMEEQQAHGWPTQGCYAGTPLLFDLQRRMVVEEC